MRMNRILKIAFALGLLAVMILPNSAFAQKRGGTMVMLVQPEPPNLASYISTSAPIGMVTAKMYDGLAEYNFDLKPIPSLAESWDISPDGKTISFKLRKGVKFHDGKPFTSADVKFSIFEVLKKYHPRGASTFRDVTAIDTPDPYTAIFRLQIPAPYMMMALSGYESPMVPKHLFENTDIRNHPNANKPIGTGPFKFAEWRPGTIYSTGPECRLLEKGATLLRPAGRSLYSRFGNPDRSLGKGRSPLCGNGRHLLFGCKTTGEAAQYFGDHKGV